MEIMTTHFLGRDPFRLETSLSTLIICDFQFLPVRGHSNRGAGCVDAG